MPQQWVDPPPKESEALDNGLTESFSPFIRSRSCWNSSRSSRRRSNRRRCRVASQSGHSSVTNSSSGAHSSKLLNCLSLLLFLPLDLIQNIQAMLVEFEGLAITGKLAEGLATATSTPPLCSTTSTKAIAIATTTTTTPGTTARLAISLGMVFPPFLVRLKVGIKERLVGRLGAITAVVT